MNTADADVALENWVKRVSEEEMPVFGRTAQELNNLVSNETSHRAQLCSVILQDASMTARLLRLANTVFYNQSGNTMSSISRAVVVLGIDGIRTLCLTVVLIDSLLKGPARERVAEEMARAFYAAVLARVIAEARGDRAPEEVFIAALLYRLGEMAFWCFGGELADNLVERIHDGHMNKDKAERELLGFPLAQLTEGLVSKWNLSDLLLITLKDRHTDNPRNQGIHLANQYATASGAEIDDAVTQKLLREIASLTNRSMEATLALIERCTNEASTTAREFGVKFTVSAPTKTAAPKKITKKIERIEQTETVETSIPNEPFEVVAPDPLLQLKILREMTLLPEENSDFNHVLEVALEGVYRGIGMDRALFTLLTPDRKLLRGKVALGADRQYLGEQFQLFVSGQGNIFSEVLESRESLWIRERNFADAIRTLPDGIRKLLNGPFFIAPVVVNNKTIGVLYADRQRSQRPLDEESFGSFRHFTQQANSTLDALSRKCPGRKPAEKTAA